MASNFFTKVVDDAKAMEKQLTGPDYPYYDYIASPGELKPTPMSEVGSISAAGDDVVAMIAYIQLLIEGRGGANMNPRKSGPGCKSGQIGGGPCPMGNAYFLKTGAYCKSPGGKLVDRYLWVNNIPNGSIPLLTKNTGITFTDFTGLIPGIMEDLGALNPMAILKGFMTGNNPPCQTIPMNTVGQPGLGAPTTNNGVQNTYHVANADIENIPACDFANGVNPITKIGCRATFTTLEDMKKQGLDTSFQKTQHTIKDNYNNIYIFLCGLLLVYMVQKLLKKS